MPNRPLELDDASRFTLNPWMEERERLMLQSTTVLSSRGTMPRLIPRNTFKAERRRYVLFTSLSRYTSPGTRVFI